MCIEKVTFLTPFDVRYVGKGQWVYLSDFVYSLRYASGLDERRVINRGAATDLASVWRMPFMYWLFGGRAHISAGIHDDLYRKRMNRAFADEVFFVAMKNEESYLVRLFMWAGVRIGGWAVYLRKRRKKR